MGEVKKRETLASRIGFLFLSAGCAIGLGNVWRFPYITGKYGGGAFVLLYLVFLVIFGLPIMVMEFSVGRASRKSIAKAFTELEPKGKKWHWYSYLAVAGNYLLMMFYTTVAGWMIAYTFYTVSGQLQGLDATGVANFFNNGLLASPEKLLFWMLLVIVIGFSICSIGLRNGVEKTTKFMMSGLFVILLVLVIRSLTLPGAKEGLSFFLKPNFKNMVADGLGETIYAAMGQSFFTLSLGIGSMLIFGSYIEKNNSLTGESINILCLDTSVAIMSGLIIFPAAAAFNVDAGAGPGLIFITLPNIFNAMAGGRIWGTLFFIFMTFAALTTIIAVFENIVAFGMELFGLSRKKSVLINMVAVTVLSVPCALGFNLLSGFAPLGPSSNVLDLEDFIVSNNLLPLGSLIFVLFCTLKSGWGWDNFIKEADEGNGIKFPNNKVIKFYVKYIIPIIIIGIFIYGYLEKFVLN